MEKIKNSRGLMLLEVLISSVILTIPLLGIASVMTSLIHNNAFRFLGG